MITLVDLVAEQPIGSQAFDDYTDLIMKVFAQEAEIANLKLQLHTSQGNQCKC